VWPSKSNGAPESLERQGFHLLHWAAGGMTYWAVSDINPEALAQFKALIVSRQGAS
jgi:anti-sigma factor RsiW